MIGLRGMGGYVNPANVATDAQAASQKGDSFVNQLPVSTIDYRGDLEVLVVNGSGFAYDDVGIVPANVLSSQGISLLPAGTQHLNNSQTVALLNSLQGPAGGVIADVQGAAFSALDTVLSGGSGTWLLLGAALIGGVVLIGAMK